jgi:hypothetical protein
MKRKGSEELADQHKANKHESKEHKKVRMLKDAKDSKHHRSTSNNRAGTNKDKYKQNDASGPITAKNSKLPDAFLDVNYKGKRSMKSIAKPDKKHPEVAVYKGSRNNDNVQPPRSSHGKSK